MEVSSRSRGGEIEEYKKLHAAVWPDVLKMRLSAAISATTRLTCASFRTALVICSPISNTQVRTPSRRIWKIMAADPTTQKWWSVCEPCQKPLEDRAKGEWWADMEEVFHLD